MNSPYSNASSLFSSSVRTEPYLGQMALGFEDNANDFGFFGERSQLELVNFRWAELCREWRCGL